MEGSFGGVDEVGQKLTNQVNKTKNYLFEKINKEDKSLAFLSKKKPQYIYYTKHEKRDAIIGT